jgi:SAM-dependent methyltransferase
MKNLIQIFKNRWFVSIVVLLGVLLFLQRFRLSSKYEGFTQNEPFAMRREAAAYDEFYAEIYDRLYKTESRSEIEATKIVETTQPDKEFSFFLDVGCGTGCLVDALKRRGYKAIGIDRSKSMVEVGKERRSKTCGDKKHGPAETLKVADANDAMLFERGVFTHILCMDRTIYEFEDKVAFFRNCKHWLQPGGYLVLHVVEPAEYNTIVPLGQPSGLFKSAGPKLVDGKRVTGTAIDFLDFKYKSNYDFSNMDKGIVVQTETFTDSASSHIRQNEHTMYMTGMKSILEHTRYCGFIPVGEFVGTEDENQKVFILKVI